MVSKDVPENSVVVGNPMRIISSYNEYIEKCRIKMRKDNCFDTYFTKKQKKKKLMNLMFYTNIVMCV